MEYLTDFRDATGFIHVRDASSGSAVSSIGRHFWQQWPNGLAFADSTLSVELFPSWSAQWQQLETGGRVSPTGLYWLQDMQHMYKELLFVFHAEALPSTSQVQDLAFAFQYHPVATIDAAWYRSTRATFDLGGFIPGQPSNCPRNALDNHYKYASNKRLNPNDAWYAFNMPSFLDPEAGYRNYAATTGGWPYCSEGFAVTGNVNDFYLAEQFAIGECNTRPQWMAGYTNARDQDLLKLTENPYAGGSWRLFVGHGISFLAADPLPNTIEFQPLLQARDDAHGWFYHVEQSYWFTANPWVKDWYEFVVEFRKARLNQDDPFPAMSDRTIGHSLHHANQAACGGRCTL